MNKFFVILNNATKDSWPDIIWSDIKNIATIKYDSTILKSKMLRKLKKLHFANRFNSKIWIPGKWIWDKSLSLRLEEMCDEDINYLLFQSTVKFSPEFIKKLKKEKNAVIILYLPDTLSKLHIAETNQQFERYCKYYSIDKVFSFEPSDCKKYGLEFFDIYSKIEINNNIWLNKENDIQPRLLYVGNCRSLKRLNLIYDVYERLKDVCKCEFYISGVTEKEIRKESDIIYNQYLTYKEVVSKVIETDYILEIVEDNQVGNTLRYKEAVCYGKTLITNNNQHALNCEQLIYFDNPSTIDLIDIQKKNKNLADNYKEEFSPKRLVEMIVSADTYKEGR